MDDSSCSLVGPSHAILKVKVPLKVRVLAWVFAHVKVLNVSMVQRRKPYCYHSSQWCVMWEKDFECLNNLMLHCPVVYSLWIRLFRGTILCWATPESCRRDENGLGAVLAIFWVAWMERNRIIFRALGGRM